MTDDEIAPRTTRIGFNMALAGAGPLTGPMHYARHLFEAMLELCDDRVEVELLGFVSRGAERHFSARAQRHLRILPALNSRIGRVFYEQLILPMRLRGEAIDVLFNPAFTGPMWGAPRIVTTVPDVYFRVVPEMVGRFQRLFLSVMVPLCCESSSAVLTISHRTAKDLVSFYPHLASRTFVTHLGSKFTGQPGPVRGYDRRAPYVLLVANLTGNKNPDVVIKAAAQCRAAGRPLKVVHVGQDHYGLLETAITDHAASGWVDSRQGISDEALQQLYSEALCLVVPSYYEGFGMPALEAQSVGTPLLSSTGGALPEVAGEGALYFDPDDADRLALHIADLLDHEDRRDDLIRLGYANAARFSWTKTARETLAHLVAAEHSAGAALDRPNPPTR